MKKIFCMVLSLAFIFAGLYPVESKAGGLVSEPEVVLATELLYYNGRTDISDDYYGEYIDHYSNIISKFNCGYSVVYKDVNIEESGFAVITTCESQAIIDINGNEIDIGEYDSIGKTHASEYWYGGFSDGIDDFCGIGVEKNTKFGYIDIDDKFALECKYDYPIRRVDENIFYMETDYYCGVYYDKDGNVLINDDSQEQYVGYIGDNVFAVHDYSGAVLKYIDVNGNELANYLPEKAHDTFEEYTGGEYNPIYVSYLFDDYFSVYNENDELRGIIKKNDEIVLPPEYEYIELAENGYCWVVKDNKWKLLKIDMQNSTDNTQESDTPSLETQEEIKVTLNGSKIAFDQPPIIQNNRTLVPFRAICEAMNATVEWDPELRQAKASLDGTEIIFTIDIPTVVVNGVEKALDQPPIIKNGRTLLPARAFAEELGASVNWVAETRTVLITK